MPPLSRLVLLLASVAGWDELSDNSTCARGGLTDAMLESYRSRVTLRNHYGATTNVSGVFLPVFSSLPLDETSAAHAAVQSAVVFIHGLSGDANSYFCDGSSAVAAAGASESVLVVAPWFGNEQVTSGEWTRSAAPDNVSAYWTTSRWLTGGDASPAPGRFTTSFDALDAVIELLLGGPTGLFPNVERVVIAGFSAGAQLASRHAFFSLADASVAWIIGDPSSWLFLDAARPAPSCCALRDTGPEHVCGEFALPADEAVAACPSFDDYKYGLSNLTSAAASNLYLEPFAANASHVAAARARWFTKDVRYLLGDEDVCNCQSAGYQNPLSDACFPSNVTCTNSEYAWNGTTCCDTYPDGTANALSVTCEVRRAARRVAHARRALDAPHSEGDARPGPPVVAAGIQPAAARFEFHGLPAVLGGVLVLVHPALRDFRRRPQRHGLLPLAAIRRVGLQCERAIRAPREWCAFCRHNGIKFPL